MLDLKLTCEFVFDAQLFTQFRILYFLTSEYEMRSKQVKIM